MNVADSERATARLRSQGYQLLEDYREADIVILNTCSVRARAEQKVSNRVGEIRKARKSEPPILGVMGCVAQLNGEELFDRIPGVRMVVGTRATDRIPELISQLENGHARAIDLGERLQDERWNILPGERTSPYTAFVPIIEGCNKFCSYCIVPFSRGREQSRPANEIIAEVRSLTEAGFSEIHLIGQNVNSYRPRTDAGLRGFQGNTPFSRLLRSVAATGMPRIKFTTSFPRDFTEDIVRALDENENLCNWIHLPVQSGSDAVLSLMRRGYKASEYMGHVKRIRDARRAYSITSDIIVGFPGESSFDFKLTLKLLEECQFDGVYIFKYSERPGTAAAGLPHQVSEDQKSVRFQELSARQQEIQTRLYARYLGKTVNVLVEGESARNRDDLTGHTTCNKPVNFSAGSYDLCGRVVDVVITDFKPNSLYGEVRL